LTDRFDPDYVNFYGDSPNCLKMTAGLGQEIIYLEVNWPSDYYDYVFCTFLLFLSICNFNWVFCIGCTTRMAENGGF